MRVTRKPHSEAEHRQEQTDESQADEFAPGGTRIPPVLRTLGGYSLNFLLIVAAVAVLMYAVSYMRLVVLPVLAALFLTNLLFPLVHRLRARGWKPGRAATTVFLTTVVLLVAVLSFLGPQVASEVQDLGVAVRSGTDQLLRYATRGPLNLSQQQIDDFTQRAFEQLSQNREQIASGLISGAVKAAEFVAGLILTLVLLFFFLKDGPGMWSWFSSKFERPARVHVEEVGRRIWTTMGAYLRGIALVGLVEATIIGIVLFVVGVPLLAPLVLLQFFAAFFPVVGAAVAGLIAALVALVTGGLFDAAIVAGAIVVIQQLDNHLLQPVVMGRAVKLHPAVVLVSLTAGSILGGVIGALLAVPVAAVASSLGNYVNTLRAHDEDSSLEELNHDR